jgi:hypothetical protein
MALDPICDSRYCAVALIGTPTHAQRGVVELPEEPHDDERAARVRAVLGPGAPDGIEALAAGVLAGPASPDRPPVPVWQYLDHLASHPDVTLDDLEQVRFPTVLYSGETTVNSIAELTAPGPTTPTYAITADDIVRLYQLKYEAGALRWNPGTRTHEEIKPADSYSGTVFPAWRTELEQRSR